MTAILRRAAAFLGGDLASRILAFAAVLYGARQLGPESYGEFAFVYACVGVGLLLADLGLTPLVLRSLSERGFTPDVFWSALVLNLALSVAVYGGLVSVLFAVDARYAPIAAVYGLVLPLQALGSSTDAVLLSTARTARVGVLRLAGNFVVALVVVVGVWQSLGALAFALAFVLGNVTKVAASTALAAPSLMRGAATVATMRSMIRKALVFSVAAIVSFLYFRVDVILLGALKGDASVGQYSAAYRFIDGLILIPGAMAYAFFPEWMRERRAAADAFVLIKLLSVVAVAATVVLSIAGPMLVTALLGPTYAGAGAALRILAFGIPFLFIDVIAVWVAYSYGREKAVIGVGLVALAANLVANAMLIPRFDFRGAAVATVISEAVNCAGYCVLFRHELRAKARFAGRAAVSAGAAS